MNDNGRKIPSNIENPFDTLLISLCDKLIDFCYTLKITPNMVTIFRMMFAIFIFDGIYISSKSNKVIDFPDRKNKE